MGFPRGTWKYCLLFTYSSPKEKQKFELLLAFQVLHRFSIRLRVEQGLGGRVQGLGWNLAPPCTALIGGITVLECKISPIHLRA